MFAALIGNINNILELLDANAGMSYYAGCPWATLLLLCGDTLWCVSKLLYCNCVVILCGVFLYYCIAIVVCPWTTVLTGTDRLTWYLTNIYFCIECLLVFFSSLSRKVYKSTAFYGISKNTSWIACFSTCIFSKGVIFTWTDVDHHKWTTTPFYGLSTNTSWIACFSACIFSKGVTFTWTDVMPNTWTTTIFSPEHRYFYMNWYGAP